MHTPLIDKNAPDHLYRQVADSLRGKIHSGEYAPGDLLPTETVLCAWYDVSRFPMRQAMAILVEEGYLVRTRGKGTFVNTQERWAQARGTAQWARGRTLGLLLAGEGDDFALDILNGFERYASEHGYVMMLIFTRSPQAELECLRRIANCGADGVVIFPIDGSMIDGEALAALIEQNVYVCFLDRHPGLEHIDYVGSDNNGGGYLAARHMHLNGYTSAVFVSDALRSGVSSVQERYVGFRRGLQQYGMRLLNDQCPQGGDCTLESLRAALPFYLDNRPFAVFAENFFMAKRVSRLLQESGLALGNDIGMVCFDDLPESRYVYPPMTAIAQNGILLGETAAALAIGKIESASCQSVRHILPTQLIVRRSCGEDRAPR